MVVGQGNGSGGNVSPDRAFLMIGLMHIGFPYEFSPGNAGSILIERAQITRDRLKRFALLIQEYESVVDFDPTRPRLPEGFQTVLEEILDGYTDPDFLRPLQAEYRTYLTVCKTSNC